MRKILYSAFILMASALTANAQQPGAVADVQHYRFALQLNDDNNIIKGQATIAAKFLKATNTFRLDLVKQRADGKGMIVASVTENGKRIKFVQDSAGLVISNATLKNSVHKYTVNYSGIPADGLIISTNKHGHRTFFGDNWAMRAQNWLPCVDNPADKASVEFIVTAPQHYTVVANGLKVAERSVGKNQKLTHWHETAKLPTKVMVIGVADFAVKSEGMAGIVPVSTYVFPEDSIAGFKGYAVATEVLPYFVKMIGPFPYKKLANVQSKTIFGGMENAGAIFYYENSVNEPAGLEALFAHEIAHQWFGDAISEKSFWHVWLSEGFATYMTNLYLEHKYGVNVLNQRLAADRKAIFDFEKKYRAPVVDSAFAGDPIKMLNTNAYQKGGFVLHMLRRQIGDTAFWKGIVNYYKLYNGSNANTNDLRLVMEQASGQSLKAFFEQWLRRAGHPVLNMSWQYNGADKTVTIKAVQQGDVFKLPLEFTVDGKSNTLQINGAETTVTIPAASANPQIIFDPNVNLLAEIIVEHNK